MKKYDPSKTPPAEKWNALKESEQLELIKNYHEMIGIPIPNIERHATLHLIVESQIAMGDSIPIGKEVQRLLGEGADRHTLIHAIGHAFSQLNKRAEAHPSIRPSPVSFFREVQAMDASKLK